MEFMFALKLMLDSGDVSTRFKWRDDNKRYEYNISGRCTAKEIKRNNRDKPFNNGYVFNCNEIYIPKVDKPYTYKD